MARRQPKASHSKDNSYNEHYEPRQHYDKEYSKGDKGKKLTQLVVQKDNLLNRGTSIIERLILNVTRPTASSIKSLVIRLMNVDSFNYYFSQNSRKAISTLSTNDAR